MWELLTMIGIVFCVAYPFKRFSDNWKKNNPGEPVFRWLDSSEVGRRGGFRKSSDDGFSGDEFGKTGISSIGLSSSNGFSHDGCSSNGHHHDLGASGFSDGFNDTVHGGIDPTFNGGMAGDHNP